MLRASILDGTSGEFGAFEQPGLLLAVDGSGKHHAGRRHAVGEQAFDQRLQLVDGREGDFDEEGLAAGDVMALLYGFEGGEKFQEGPVVLVVAGQSDEGDDGVAERAFVEDGAIAQDDALVLQLADALGDGGWRQAYPAAKFGEGKPGIGGKRPHDVVVDGIKIVGHCWPPERQRALADLRHEELNSPRFRISQIRANYRLIANGSSAADNYIRWIVGFIDILE